MFSPTNVWPCCWHSPCSERPVEIEGGADQSQMSEGLREVAQGLAAGTGLLGVQADMVGITEHLLEEQPGVIQPGRVGAAGARERLDEPEGTHVEGPLAARQAVRGGCG